MCDFKNMKELIAWMINDKLVCYKNKIFKYDDDVHLCVSEFKYPLDWIKMESPTYNLAANISELKKITELELPKWYNNPKRGETFTYAGENPTEIIFLEGGESNFGEYWVMWDCKFSRVVTINPSLQLTETPRC